MPVIILLEKLFVFKNGWLLFFKEKLGKVESGKWKVKSEKYRTTRF
jgi:hypothetical protein